MYFFEQLIYEVQNPQEAAVYPQQASTYTQEYPVDANGNAIDPNLAVDPEQIVDQAATPIKRYFLVKKIYALNEKLNQLHVKNEVLNFLVNFIDDFSYDVLLVIMKKLVEEIQLQIQSQGQTIIYKKSEV
jgi:hypothetical protein